MKRRDPVPRPTTDQGLMTNDHSTRKVTTMTNHWDELSKSLAEESLPRRESLRRLGLESSSQ